jgi:hypothetical protein
MRESALKDQIVALGEGRRDFRVNVSISSRSNLDLAAVRAILSDAVVEKLTRVSYVTTVRVTARSRIAA